MAFQVLTRKPGDTNFTVGTSRATLALCDADIAAALRAEPANVFIAVRDDTGTTLVSRYAVIRDWPPGVAAGVP